ncbi:unnamed protein product [Didymodactylos carnosus]|uniref:Striatin N-terminal domain-containing protein n=1 Tax=Didymodactylos carnosus TaxID=1234261 RepID=A0A814J9U5_9BILA|nr:unnamed protein product [Didymodactylos carnosus]CAF3805289.1 unnamed protein product [Didymodactylos carnosus]
MNNLDGGEANIGVQYQPEATSSSAPVTTVDPQRPLYTVPGILHFLQHEWTRFEIERQQWETERAELLARIAFLQGERQGQENLKSALVKRIKMLEYALKQERLKFNKLKYGTDNAPVEDPKLNAAENHLEDDDLKEDTSLSFGGSSVSFKQGRQLLRQYLKEIGYVDTIIDIRSTAVKKLLGIKSDNDLNPNVVNNNIGTSSGGMNGDLKPSYDPKRVIPGIIKNAANDLSKSVLASLVFLKDEQPDGQDDDSGDDDLDASRIIVKSNNTNISNNILGGNSNNNHHIQHHGMDTLNDLESEEAALQEFDFLADPSSNVLGNVGLNELKTHDASGNEWDVDQSRLHRLKEEYKRDRIGKKPHQQQTSSSLRNTLVSIGNNDNGNDDTSNDARPYSDDEQMSREMVDSMMFRNSKNFMGENAMEGLDELARVTVQNDNEPLYDTTTESVDFRKTWNVKFVLRSHLDGVRCVAFHPVESVVVTGSEDRTLKLWNLEKSATMRKSTSATQDLEPIYTFRRHTMSVHHFSGPVLCVAMNPSGEQFYSGGLDSMITVWNIPDSDIDPYDAYGHTDAVWRLAICGQKLLSCAADGTVRLWDPNINNPLQSIINSSLEEGIPTSIDWLTQETNHFVVSYDTFKSVIYDVETSKALLRLENDNQTSDSSYRINRVISHPSQALVITAHDDRKIRFYDSNTGKMVHSMVAHLDAVTSLAIDPQQTCLLSGSHDRSIRLWNLDNKSCVQEVTAHQKKDDESVHDVAFHYSKSYLASVGADSIAKIYA